MEYTGPVSEYEVLEAFPFYAEDGVTVTGMNEVGETISVPDEIGEKYVVLGNLKKVEKKEDAVVTPEGVATTAQEQQATAVQDNSTQVASGPANASAERENGEDAEVAARLTDRKITRLLQEKVGRLLPVIKDVMKVENLTDEEAVEKFFTVCEGAVDQSVEGAEDL